MKKPYELEIVTKDFTHIVQSVILPPGVFNQPDLQNLAFLIGEREEIGPFKSRMEISSDLIYYNKKWHRSSTCQSDLVILK